MTSTPPTIEPVTLPCPRLPPAFDGLTILHLSDLHITRWTAALTAWQGRLAELKADLVVITGDLGHRSWHWKEAIVSLKRLLDPLEPPLGTFFILGNHDSLKIGPGMANPQRHWMQNESVVIPSPKGAGGRRLALIGLNQQRRLDTDIPAAMRQVRPEDFKLMLMHYPDLIHQAAAAGVDVCLAGHTHGGQICWPDGSPMFRHDTLPKNMCTGVHRVNGTWMVVNRGIGVAGLRMRLFCPPHAILLTLKAE